MTKKQADQTLPAIVNTDTLPENDQTLPESGENTMTNDTQNLPENDQTLPENDTAENAPSDYTTVTTAQNSLKLTKLAQVLSMLKVEVQSTGGHWYANSTAKNTTYAEKFGDLTAAVNGALGYALKMAQLQVKLSETKALNAFDVRAQMKHAGNVKAVETIKNTIDYVAGQTIVE